jgi:hypothetical protein
METVKIVFDIDSKDVKTTTEELKALNKVTNDEVKALDNLSNAATDAGDGFVSLRSQVRQAKEEAQKAAEKYGEFSKEANTARNRAGALADQMGDLNRQVNLLNPEAKAKAFSNLAQGVVGAFAVATGALQAFGVKNKEVEALAMKLQGALNITQGIASIGELKESLSDLKVILGFTTVAQEGLTAANTAEGVSATGAAAATKSFTAALLTNPIFLAVSAIALLAGAMIALSDDTEIAKTQVDLMTESQKGLRQATNDAADAADRLAVAQGKLSSSQAQINKTIRDNNTEVEDLNEKIKENNGQIKDNNTIIEKNKNELQKYTDAVKFNKKAVEDGTRTQEQANKSIKSYITEGVQQALSADAANKKLAESNRDLLGTIKAKNTAIVETVDAIKQEKKNQDTDKAIQDSKKLTAEEVQAAKERLRIADELRKKLQENALAQETDPLKRIQLARQFANEEYALQDQRLVNEKASQDERDKLAADHTATVIKLNNDETNANKTRNDKILASEKKLQDALLALKLSKETDPLKRAQIINDAKEQEIDNQLALVEKGSVEEQALLADKERAEIEAQKRIAAAQIEINKTTNKDITEEDKKAAEDRKALQEGILQSAQFVGQAIFEASANQTNAELALLEEQKNQKLISEKDYQEKVRKLKQKQAEDQKKEAIFNATVDLARAIIAALTIAPPASAVAANFAAILGGANLAKIIATPVPRFQKGTLAVPGVDMGRDSVHAMLQPGEAVIPVSTNRAYHPTIKAIYEKKISPSEINNFVMSRTSSAGRQSVTASVDTYALSRALGKNKTVEVGNAGMIGRAMAKELLRGQNLRRS